MIGCLLSRGPVPPRFLFWAVVGVGMLGVRTGLFAAESDASEKPAVLAADAIPAEQKKGGDDEYLQLFQLFADAFDQVDRNYVKPVDRRRLMESAIRGMLADLDPYSGYISPQHLRSFKTGVENEFGGVGVQVSAENGRLVVISPLVGSPAYRGGLMAGDMILEIDG